MGGLLDFIRESNRIEGILREPTDAEHDAHMTLLNGPITLGGLVEFVSTIAPGKALRAAPGMNVRVGNHIAPRGGPDIEPALRRIIARVNKLDDPYETHQEYERLHPFMDGNGRSGRALWLWMMLRRDGPDPFALPFLHRWYYQSLGASAPSPAGAEG